MTNRLREFINRHLDPADRLGEILFGLIMALGFTAAVRLGVEEPDNRKLFVSILGCNLAWGIVDGVMYVLTAVFERARKARIIRAVRAAPTEEDALARVSREFEDVLAPLTTAEERREMYRWIARLAKREVPLHVGVHRADVMGAAAVALLIVLSTLPVVVPFLLVPNPVLASRLSNLIVLALLFLVGHWWGKVVGASPWRIGVGLTLVGICLVAITITLGG